MQFSPCWKYTGIFRMGLSRSSLQTSKILIKSPKLYFRRQDRQPKFIFRILIRNYRHVHTVSPEATLSYLRIELQQQAEVHFVWVKSGDKKKPQPKSEEGDAKGRLEAPHPIFFPKRSHATNGSAPDTSARRQRRAPFHPRPLFWLSAVYGALSCQNSWNFFFGSGPCVLWNGWLKKWVIKKEIVVGKMYLSLQQYSTRCAAGTVFMETELLSQVNKSNHVVSVQLAYRWDSRYKPVAKSPSGGVIESNIYRV